MEGTVGHVHERWRGQTVVIWPAEFRASSLIGWFMGAVVRLLEVLGGC